MKQIIVLAGFIVLGLFIFGLLTDPVQKAASGLLDKQVSSITDTIIK